MMDGSLLDSAAAVGEYTEGLFVVREYPYEFTSASGATVTRYRVVLPVVYIDKGGGKKKVDLYIQNGMIKADADRLCSLLNHYSDGYYAGSDW